MLARIVALCLCWLAVAVHAAPADTIEVAVTIQDEVGQPIPYVAVWSTSGLTHAATGQSARPPLSADDLWRVTQRYGVLHDIICEVGDKPVPTLRIPVMGDAAGLFRETLDVTRPARQPLAYTFLKRGYLPGRVGFNVPTGQSRVEATVTLKRNPGEALEAQPYLAEFARLRYELSDAVRNASLTDENQQRVLALPVQMEAAAQQALAAGDKPAAARIYSRMRYMPSPDVVDGRITGWIDGDAGSRQARRAMERAYELDPDSLYVWMQTYMRRRSLLPNPTTEERIAAALYEVEKLIAAKGEAVWPQCLADQAASHALLGHYETAYRLYREAARREPKYMDWNEEIRKLKDSMKEAGVPIPAE